MLLQIIWSQINLINVKKDASYRWVKHALMLSNCSYVFVCYKKYSVLLWKLIPKESTQLITLLCFTLNDHNFSSTRKWERIKARSFKIYQQIERPETDLVLNVKAGSLSFVEKGDKLSQITSHLLLNRNVGSDLGRLNTRV